jgi:GNAT superfamily N-acetyltransferase
MASVQVHHLEKKGPHSKFFDSEAAKHTRDIYAEQFGPSSEKVTKRCVREMDVKYLIRISDEHGHTIAATMLRESGYMHYRICGLAVAAGHQRKGLGSMLLRRIEAVLPNHSTVELGVDVGKTTTEWLQAWYARFGYEQVGANAIEVVMVKRIERQAD